MIARFIAVSASCLSALTLIGCDASDTPAGNEIIVNNEPSAMSEEELFLDSQHFVSLRFAVLEDDGTSAWLYLTEADARKPVGDAWIYNRIPAPSAQDIRSYRGGPPPAATGYASDSVLCHSPGDHDWSFIWATDGNSVAVAKDGVPVAFIVLDRKSGYSRELIKDGPGGRVWSDEEFDRVF